MAPTACCWTPARLSKSLNWTNADVIYRADQQHHGPAGMMLTVGPGQIVKMRGSLTVNGSPAGARHTAAERPVVFTSITADTLRRRHEQQRHEQHARTPVSGAPSSSRHEQRPTSLTKPRFCTAAAMEPLLHLYAQSAPLTLTNSAVRQFRVRAASAWSIQTPHCAATPSPATNGAATSSTDLDSNPTITGRIGREPGRQQHQLPWSWTAGTLAKSLNWTNPDIVYAMSNSIVVPAGMTLTLAPGQVVKMRGNLTVSGTLQAQGTAANPIILTSISDDTFGGDTNNNGTGNTPHAGEWGTIQFNAGSTNKRP